MVMHCEISQKLRFTMKVEAVVALRAKLSAGEAVHGMWVTTEAVAVTELAVGLGMECVCWLS